MNSPSLLRTDAVGDVMVLELRDISGMLPEHDMLNDFELARRYRAEGGWTKVAFDLGKAQFFGSTLLELIRVLWNDLAAVNGKLVLFNPSAFGREVLEIAKFNQIWPLVDSREMAMGLLTGAVASTGWPANVADSFHRYVAGPNLLRQSLDGLSSIQLRTPSPPGVWNALQVVCHISDFELVYADRMKRVIAEDQPTLFGGDPDIFASHLAYAHRDVDEELAVIESVRKSTARFLQTLPANAFDRCGIHSVDGPLSLAELLRRISGHIPHHAQIVEGKKRNLLEAAD